MSKSDEEGLEYTAGDTVVTSCGEYSDYNFNKVFKVLKDFNIKSTLQMWVTLGDTGVVLNRDGTINNYESDCVHHEPMETYLKWLEDSGVIEDIKYKELHTGCYGDIKLTSYTE